LRFLLSEESSNTQDDDTFDQGDVTGECRIAWKLRDSRDGVSDIEYDMGLVEPVKGWWVSSTDFLYLVQSLVVLVVSTMLEMPLGITTVYGTKLVSFLVLSISSTI